MKDNASLPSLVTGIEAISHAASAFSEMIIHSRVTPAHHIARSFTRNPRVNCYGNRIDVHELPSELGAAGCIHGAATTGSLVSSITCGDALVLQAPVLHRIVGDGLPVVFNIPSRAITRQESSMFPDHSDVMSVRSTGIPMVSSTSVQSAYDFAILSQVAAVECHLPFLHFFDGTKILNQTQQISMLDEVSLRELMPREILDGFMEQRLSPSRPAMRGTIGNSDTYFHGFERANDWFNRAPERVQNVMERFGRATGRRYDPVEYYGAPITQVQDVLIGMGSCTETLKRVVNHMNKHGDRRVGLFTVSLYRPFPFDYLIYWLKMMRGLEHITVLDRTLETPSQPRNPLYYDILEAMVRAGKADVKILGATHGIGGHTLSPRNGLTLFENMALPKPMDHISVGLANAVGLESLSIVNNDTDPPLRLSDAEGVDIMFFGTGADGTKTVSRALAKMVDRTTDLRVTHQFRESDERMALGQCATLLHIGHTAHDDPYMQRGMANFVGINLPYLTKLQYLDYIKEGATVVINMKPDTDFDKVLPPRFKKIIADRHAKLYAIDIGAINRACGLSPRKQSTAMATACVCLFLGKYDQPHSIWRHLPERTATMHSVGTFMTSLLDILPRDSTGLKNKRIENATVVSMASNAILPRAAGTTLCDVPAHEIFREVEYSPVSWAAASSTDVGPEMVEAGNIEAPLVDDIKAMAYGDRGHIMSEQGQLGGGELRRAYESMAKHVPSWLPQFCTQCYQCSLACPHGALRIIHWREDEDDADFRASKRYQADPKEKSKRPFIGLPAKLLSRPPISDPGFMFRVQVNQQLCTECGVCYQACPTDSLTPIHVDSDPDAKSNKERARSLGYVGSKLKEGSFMADQYSLEDITELRHTVEGSQLFRPLYVSDNSCPGCGIPAYLKLLTQLVGSNVIFVGSDGCITSNLATVNSSALQADVSAADTAPCFTRSTPGNAMEHAMGIVSRLAHVRAELTRQINTLVETQSSSNPYYQAGGVNAYLPTPMLTDISSGLVPALRRWLTLGDNPDHARDIHDFVAHVFQHELIESYYDNNDLFSPDARALGVIKKLLSFLEPVQVVTTGSDRWARANKSSIMHAMNRSDRVRLVIADGQYETSSTDSAVRWPDPIARQYVGTNAYVAQISLSDPLHTIQCMRRAFEYPGPSLLVALAPCKDWKLSGGLSQSLPAMKRAVRCGFWPLYSYDPMAPQPKSIRAATIDRPVFDEFVASQYRFATRQDGYVETMWEGIRDHVNWVNGNARGPL
ncbi:Pyruvate flavodoxin oxidoreductase [Carpediemonas membranifera]|uniref:Pyruvate flavodoxin oxidoreductase n=1 Tax=Carpediemonas membranifera TaxID=201153 RepID=A0A8J6E0M6_9EUKA|nr:Pyruvate flavodoxin oxidoreductase [Carpediemonas membranifera]|eukprot:KAG9389542.1 Pyruvate flavodoxin oxidoreductase [Carpediemonas membranifera]